MKRSKIKRFEYFAVVFAVACFVFCARTAKAETFCVQTSSTFQSALHTAANNGEADEIQIVQGTYTGNFTYETQEGYKLTVKGGYAAGCSSRVVSASNTILDGNSAGTVLMVDSDGGSAFECDGVTLQNGSADRGGGLRIASVNGNVTFSNNVVSGNRATEFGGGIHITSNATVTLTNNTIRNNESDYYSGGASIGGATTGTGALVLIANSIIGNTADGAVGGLMTWCNSVSITNNLFFNNSSLWYHGALLIDGSNVTKVINNTITANTSEGLGAGLTIQLDDDSDRADVYNNIIYNNTGYWEANDLAIFNDQEENGVASPVSLLNNDFDQSSAGTFIQIPFTIDPGNLNNQDPLFVSASTGDYHLLKGSPCIDTGTSTDAPVTDIVGTLRPQGQAYDMGAYEYVGIPVPDIKANSQDGSITVSSGAPISITVSLNPDNLSGQNADWWVVESAPDGVFYHFDLSLGSMVPGLLPTYQGPLFSLGTSQLLNSSDLALGTHTFYFAVDLNMNGTLDMNSIYYDRVNISVTAP
ncbi:MAG: hypothetical protein B6240_14515 [Desulfobacteraceae bacterium 4572_87]|nr:MAG: hypothetical protein B6240_14515 [Desulfobacteraceae bacterium 4572_87]